MTPRVLFVSIVVAVLAGRPALAQVAPQIRTQVDANLVGICDVVHLTVSATSSDPMPTDPQIGPTPGFVERARNPSPSETHFNINGAQTDRYTLTVDFVLQATRVGTFTVGPPSVAVGHPRFPSQPATPHVVPARKPPPPPPRPPPHPTPSRLPFSPF